MAYDNRYNNNPRLGPQGGQQRGGYNKQRSDDVSTNGITIYNEQVGRFLRTRFWNGTLGLDIGVYPPGNPPSFETMRNAQIFGHVFSFSAVFELLEICDGVMLSLKESNRFESTAIVAGTKRDCIVEISNGDNISMTPGVYLVIYKNVDMDKRSNTYEIYPFSSTSVLRGYDHNSGRANTDIKANGNFKKFIRILNEAANAFTMAQAHVVAEARKSEKTATFTALSAIAAALGVDTKKSVEAVSRSGANAYANNRQQFQRRSQEGQWNGNRGGGYRGNYAQQQQALAAVTDEPVDINLDAATLQNIDLNQFNG